MGEVLSLRDKRHKISDGCHCFDDFCRYCWIEDDDDPMKKQQEHAACWREDAG